MKNTNQIEAGSQAATLKVCEVCKQTGKYGAGWLVYIEGQTQPVLVHKPCGERFVESAPEGVRAKVVASRGLRELWDRQRQEKLARSLWDQKFSQAKPILKPAPTSPLEAVTVQTAQAA